MMDPAWRSHLRPEAMGDVPGVCALPLTRAIVRYRDVHEVDADHASVDDLGLGLVLDGTYAAAAEVLDLGSGRTRVLDLSRELVVLDWVYEPTHDHVLGLVDAARTTGQDAELQRYGFRMAAHLLERLGFGPLTRPILLQIGFRDLCRDFDLHDGASIRILWGGGRVIRAHLDGDASTLVLRTSLKEADPLLEQALLDAFGAEARIVRRRPASGARTLEYRARFAAPDTLPEARAMLSAVRAGVGALLARCEPDRFAALSHLVDTFGARETLATLHFEGGHADRVLPAQRVVTAPAAPARPDPAVYEGAGFLSAALH